MGSLSNKEFHLLPCYGKFLTKQKGDHSLYAAIGRDTKYLNEVGRTLIVK
jgi:hypothetical protein